MVQATLRRFSLPAPGSLQSTYIIEGLVDVTDVTNQPIGTVPVPFTSADKALLINISGQLNTFTISFIMLDRTDDFTNGTGSSGDGSPNTQRNWLKNNVCSAVGFQVLNDNFGNQYSGRVENFQIRNNADDPIKMDVSMTFIVGRTVGL